MNARRGHTLLEVAAVLALLALVVGVSLFGLGNSQERELIQKVNRDLLLLDSAKCAWRVANPLAVLVDNEAGRFAAVQPFVKVGLQPVASLSALQPNASLGNVTYFLNAEGQPASAYNSDKSAWFNRATLAWDH